MGKYMNPPAIFSSLFGGIVTYLLGGWDTLAKAFIVLMVLDYFTGILKAIYTKTLSSRIGVKGIITKVSYIAIVSVAVIASEVWNIPTIREMVLCFFIANECISILENAVESGAKLPTKLKEVLLQLRDKDNSEGG